MNHSGGGVKILMIGPAPPQAGGIETFIGDLLDSGIRRDFDIRLLNIGKFRLSRRAKNVEHVGYDTIFKRLILLSLWSYSYSALFFLRYMWALISFRPHIVHIHSASYTSFWEKTAYVYSAKCMKRKIVFHSHGGFFQEFYNDSGALAKNLIKKVLQAADRLVVLSGSWADFYSAIVPGEKMRIVPNGINVSRFELGAATKSRIPSFLYVGRVSEHKGVYDLIRATMRNIRNGFDCEIWLMGTGELDQVRELSSELGIEKQVIILGAKFGKEKLAIYGRAWCFVLPSHAEAMPVTLLEAFAAGLPVICTRVGAIPQMVADGENGYLFNRYDITELARLMRYLAQSTDAARRIGETNRKKAIEQYDIQKSAALIKNIYRELI